MSRKINPKLHQQHKKSRPLLQYRDVFDPDQCIKLALHHLSAPKIRKKRVLLVLCDPQLQ